jgi:translation elongation factor EF-Tu-like GTPase
MLVEVWFLENIRKNPPYGTIYRPHFVVNGDDYYLGVQFENLPEKPFGEHITANIKLLYEGVDYSKLKQGTNFDIKEGSLTVGKGIVHEL